MFTDYQFRVVVTNLDIVVNEVYNDTCLFFTENYNPPANQEYNLLFGAAFTDPDDNYWYKKTKLNLTLPYFQDYPAMIDMIEDGAKAVKILQVDNNGEHKTKLVISATDSFGEGED